MTKKIRLTLSIVFVLLYLLLSCLPTTILPVYASSIQVDGGYTSVLEDLSTDESFNADDYVVIEDDYSLQVIQIAESSDKELFVYVYQPSAEYGNLVASSINISADLHNELNIKNYKLTLLNKAGVFYKYIVKGLAVSGATTRYYEIISIFRLWDESIDKDLESTNENTIDEVVYKVAKQYTVIEKDGKSYTSVADIETVTVTDKYVGFMRYKNNDAPSWIDRDSVDSHYVAFATDRDIDRLFEADVYYTTQDVHRYGYNTWESDFTDAYFDTVSENYAYLNYTQKSTFENTKLDGFIWHSIKYSFERIQSVRDFVATENRAYMFSNGIFNTTVQSKITDEGFQDLQDMQWVLRFAETDYSIDTTTHITNIGNPIDCLGWEKYTIVGDVTILRLKFETDGVVYNLGVIDNKQSSNGVPDNATTVTMELGDMFKIILTLLFIIIIVAILGPFLPTVISFVFWLIKIVLKVVIWIVSLPFKLLGKIFGKRE